MPLHAKEQGGVGIGHSDNCLQELTCLVEHPAGNAGVTETREAVAEGLAVNAILVGTGFWRRT